MAIAGPQAPQAPTPPAVPGLDAASEAVGGLPDFGASGQSAIEGAQQRAADAAQAGQDAAANARAAGERLMGTPERKTQEKTAGEEPGKEGKLAQKPAAAAPEASGTKSQTTSSEATNLPPAAQAAQAAQAVQEKPGTETRVPKPSADEPPQGFGMMHLAVVAVLCACLAGIFAYKFLHRKKGEPTPAMRAAHEAELLADLETMRAARERRESDRAAKVAAAGLSAIAGAAVRTAPEAAGAAEVPPAVAASAATSKGVPPQTSTPVGAKSSVGAAPAPASLLRAAASAASPDASMLASLSEALSAFREASRMMEGEAGVKATEEAKKAARTAAIRQDREEKQDGEHGGFEIRI